jgi:2-polyprenyl-6-methoxyphenol hydroxylase-like FAD-dependent oxidoreductase
MAEKIWKAAALMVAAHIRTHHYDFQRGLLLIPRSQDDTVIVWVFGNDPEPDETTLDHEVERIRSRLQEKPLEELGFGLSADHHTWVLVLRTDTSGHHTKAGKAFQLEMLKSWLDDVIQQAWNDTHTAEEEAGVGLSTC